MFIKGIRVNVNHHGHIHGIDDSRVGNVLTWTTACRSPAVLIREFVSGRIHVHTAEGREFRVEQSLLHSGQLDLPQGRVVVGVAGHLHWTHPLSRFSMNVHRRHRARRQRCYRTIRFL